MIFQPFINKMTLQPKKLFLVDGFGALLSAFLLGVVLTRFETTFGMPQQELYFLALLACVFAVYDFVCYFRITGNPKLFLKIIALINLMYCCITIGLVIHLHQKLTALGLIYFILEFLILIVLIIIELKTAANLNRK